MVVKNNDNKTSEHSRASLLSRVKFCYERPHVEHRVSPNFGKKQPWYVRAYETTAGATVSFLIDVARAIKTIIRGIM